MASPLSLGIRSVAASVAIVLFVPIANACSPAEEAYVEVPMAVASRGYLVEGRIIRGYDAIRRTPEILQVDRIFVGDGMPRRIVIARDDRFFDQRAQGIRDTCSYEFTVPDERPRLYALFPAKPDPAHPGEERWALDSFSTLATSERGLDILFAEATRAGRLRGKPPEPQR